MKLSGYFIAMLLVLQAVAQQPTAATQLKMILNLPDDTARVNKLNALATSVFAINPAFTVELLNKSIELSDKIKYPLGGSVAYGTKASLLIYEMKLDSSVLMLNNAFALVRDHKEKAFVNQQANLHNKYGSILQQQQLYDTAIKKYLQAAELYRQTNNEQLAIVGYYNISVMYGLLAEPDKSLFYARQVQRIAHSSANPEFLQRSYIALGDAFAAAKQYDSLLYYVQLNAGGENVAANPFIAGKHYQQMGIYNLRGKKNYPAAVHYFDSSLVEFEKLNLPYEKALIYQNLGNTYLQQKDYSNAVKFATIAVNLCKAFDMYDLMIKSIQDLAAAAEGSGDVKKAHEYLKAYLTLKDTVDQRNKSKLVNELEARYQSQKKEARLLAQQNTISKKTTLNYILIASAGTLLIISLLFYRTYRQKQLLQQQRINELETEKQLTATGAVLKGEEQERTRLAKELHDGLGGMLSGIKYSFQNMKGSLVMTTDNALAFERSIDMLDSSIQEMRRVAHNLMPETLLKFGLDTSLRDFCSDINKTGVLQVNYRSIGIENLDIDQTTAISIYRIVQELMNNTMKHAAATTAIVQVTRVNHTLSITVEDNGKGFDTLLLQETKGIPSGRDGGRGIGWSNIRGRVDYLKGHLDVKSGAATGTSVHIELTIADV